jgi:hypothetical protein
MKLRAIRAMFLPGKLMEAPGARPETRSARRRRN